MSIRKKVLLVSVTAVVTIGLVFAGAQQTSSAPAPKPTIKQQYGGILKIIYSRDSDKFGYPPLVSGIGIFAGRPALEPLFGLDSNVRFQPTYLVTAWKLAPDGMSGTMTLRKGVKFHDGTDFNAQAVKWNLERSKQAKVIGTDTWKSIEALDDYTVRINLTQFDSGLEERLGGQISMPVSPTAVQKYGEDWMLTHPVGTGPFKFKSYERDVSIKYEKFDGYWQKGQPYLDGIEILPVKDLMVGMAALRAGQGHLIFNSSTEYAKTLKDLGFNVAARMSTIVSICPDSANPKSVLANKKVREALEHAIDRKALASLGQGYWRAAYQWAIPEYPLGYNADLPGREYNPAKAKQLLAEAGYPNGFKTKIIFDIGHRLMDPMTAVQSFWKAVGVDTTLEQMPRAQYLEHRDKGWHDGFLDMNNALTGMFINVIPRVLSPDLKIVVSTQRPPGYAEAIKQTVATLDFETMKARTQAVVRVLYENASVIPLFSWSEPVPMEKSVNDTGIAEQNSFHLWTPETCWLSK
jgi:peptide/nickel transport system substrate-binding protein